jgi:hypothetical protein
MVEPMRVVDDGEERPLLGCLGHKAKYSQSDQERIWRRPRAESKCDAECLVLRPREAVQKVEKRGAELLQRGEWQLHLRLDAGRPGNPEFSPRLDGVIEQRGFPHTCLPVHDQHATASTVQKPVEDLALAFTAEQLPSRRNPTKYPSSGPHLC